MTASTKVQIQLEVSYEDIWGFINQLNIQQKIAILEKLRMQAFKENWLKLSEEVPQAGISDEGIMAEEDEIN